MVARGAPFVHLHVHSEYSLLDGTCRLHSLAQRSAEMGLSAVALSDHGVLHGVIPFQAACKEAGIKPIFGCEVYVTQGSRHDKSGKPAANGEMFHLLLLAETQDGYKNLLKIVSAAHLEGFYYKPRIDRELLAAHHEGIIAASACLQGEIPNLLLQGREAEARKLAGEYAELMGPNNFFIEVMDHGIPEQKTVNPRLIGLAKELNLPLIATNDTHYTNQSDAEAHDVLLCIQTNSSRDDPKRLRFHGEEFYLKSAEEMAALFADNPEALTNTMEIAERCAVEIETGNMILPQFPVPEGQTQDSYLRKLAMEKLGERFPNPSGELKKRLEKELSILEKRGLAAFILIAWDLMDFARKHDILVGPGRGSAPGALLLYILGVTEINPIRFGLPFERWMNLERMSMPDIDCDFEPARRGEVIQYIASKYGSDKAAQIITFGSIGAKQALRDAGRVLRVPIPEVDRICKRIGMAQTLSEFLGQDAEIRKELEGNPTLKQLMETARAIEGLARHAGTHAGGVVISREPLVDLVPLQRVTGAAEARGAKRNGNSEEESPLRAMTQFDMDAISAVGLPKMDVLGLRTLGVLRETLRLVEETRKKKVDISAISLEDRPTYELLGRGETNGVFQLESAGMKQVLRDLRPDRFDDIVAVVALYRPGPMAQIPNYIAGKHGRRKVTYLHPDLEPILSETFGIIVYQEQVMEIARQLAGFSLGKADALLNAMRKKKRELMDSLGSEFMKWATKRGVSEKVAKDVFQQMSDFAGYGFNKAHSACYAMSAYQTAFLKANFGPEYMAAQLSSVMDNKDKLSGLMLECRRIGITVLPPDINESEDGFSVVGNDVRFGLAAIKHLGVNAIKAILAERAANGRFESFEELCNRMPAGSINKTGVEVLAKSGALSSLGETRSGLAAAIEAGMLPGKASSVSADQESLFGMEETTATTTYVTSFAGAPIPEYPLSELLALEKELLGLYLSDHPLNGVKDALENFTTSTIAGLAEQETKEAIIGGIISGLRHHTDRSGRPMAFVTLEDFSGAAELTVFASAFEKSRGALQQDAIVLVKGRAEAGTRDDNEEDAAPRMLVDEIVLLTDVKGRERLRRGKNRRPAPNNSNRRNHGNHTGRNNNNAAPQPPPRPRKEAVKPKGTRAVHIRLSAKEPQKLDELKRVIGKHSGAAPVLLHLDSAAGQRILRLGAEFGVEPSEGLLRQLNELLGEETVWLDAQ